MDLLFRIRSENHPTVQSSSLVNVKQSEKRWRWEDMIYCSWWRRKKTDGKTETPSKAVAEETSSIWCPLHGYGCFMVTRWFTDLTASCMLTTSIDQAIWPVLWMGAKCHPHHFMCCWFQKLALNHTSLVGHHDFWETFQKYFFLKNTWGQ